MVRCIITCSLACLFCLSAGLSGNTLVVPDDHAAIQDAIAAAAPGDCVFVKPGTYRENLDFLGKAIAVKSAEGPEATVIDGGRPCSKFAGSCVTFRSGEGPGSVLEGFTLTNGQGDYIQEGLGFTYGGGVLCAYGSSPAIRGNRIVGNNALPDTTGRGAASP